MEIVQQIGSKMVDLSVRIHGRVFPKEVRPDERLLSMLSKIYPTLDLERVRFFEGLPWYVDKRFANAITLPGFYAFRDVHLYFTSFDGNDPASLSTIIHECFHALQYQELSRFSGLGMFRIFLMHYFAQYMRLMLRFYPKLPMHQAHLLAYEQHPMEIPAFEQDYRSRDFMDQFGIGQIYEQPGAELIVEQTGHRYDSGFFLLFLSTLAVFLCSVVIPVVEVLLMGSAGVIWILGRMLQGSISNP